MRVLAESKNYKVYSIEESIYLQDKRESHSSEEFSEKDKFIDSHYGNPTGAIFIQHSNEKYIVISGCGLTIYEVENGIVHNYLVDKNKPLWTNGIHQDELDNLNEEFRFVMFNKLNQLRVFKMNMISEKITELS